MKTYSRRKKGKRDRLPKEELIGNYICFRFNNNSSC